MTIGSAMDVGKDPWKIILTPHGLEWPKTKVLRSFKLPSAFSEANFASTACKGSISIESTCIKATLSHCWLRQGLVYPILNNLLTLSS